METAAKPAVGTIGGFDLTVAEAPAIRDFYASVIGWQVDELDMGGYADYFMKSPASGEIAAGVCHARGMNAGLPAQWLAYIVVEDIEASRQRCVDGGGTLLTGISGSEGSSRYCVIQDPAGAVLALLQLGDE